MTDRLLGWVNVCLGAVNIGMFIVTGSLVAGFVGTWCLMIGTICLVD